MSLAEVNQGLQDLSDVPGSGAAEAAREAFGVDRNRADRQDLVQCLDLVGDRFGPG